MNSISLPVIRSVFCPHYRQGFLAAWMFILFPGFLSAQEAAAPPMTLGAYRLELEINRQKIGQPVSKLNEQYAGKLKELEDKARGAGELNFVLAVQEELKGFAAGESKPVGDEFAALKKLQDIYRAERAKREKAEAERLSPLFEKYRADLAALQKRLTQENQLEEAIKVQTEMAKVDEWEAESSGFLEGGSGAVAGAEKKELTTIGVSSSEEVKGGRLRGFGNFAGGAAADVGKAKRYSDFVSVAVIGNGWMALRANGEVITNVPARAALEEEKAVGLCAGYPSGSAGVYTILRKGTIAMSGAPFPLPIEFEKGLKECRKIARTDTLAMALWEDGSVTVWGSATEAEGAIPPPKDVDSDIIDISTYRPGWCFAVKEDGRVIHWATGGAKIDVPESIKEVVAVESGLGHCLALTRTGNVLAWGRGLGNPALVPSDLGECAAIRASRSSSAARKLDGTWRAWGYNAGGVIDKINTLGKALDLGFYIDNVSSTGYVVWIEPKE